MGCKSDKGFLMGLDVQGTIACSYEILQASQAYPQFLYSKSDTEVVWHSKGMVQLNYSTFVKNLINCLTNNFSQILKYFLFIYLFW